MNKYEIGDIVFVSKYEYSNGKIGKSHLFVIIDIDDEQLIPIEYFGLIVSSHREKANNKSKFKFNELLKKNKINNLNVDSIVKCDQLYKIPKKNIKFKIGCVDIDDFVRFINTYENYLSISEVNAI